MYLKDDELRQGIINDFSEDNFGNISYDLQIKEILTGGKHLSEYDLKPNETVFISTIETLDMPKNMFGKVVIRNSAIRLGLDINAPIYQPGHKTRIFCRVTNFSSAVIKLKQKSSICSLMVYKFDEDTSKPYSGVYVDEFDYRGVGDFHSVEVPKISFFEKKIRDIENLEKHLYGNVMLMLTIFVAIFSLVNLNTATLRDSYGLNEILAFNFVFLCAISTLVLLIAEIIGSLKGRRILYLTPIVTLIVAVFFWINK